MITFYALRLLLLLLVSIFIEGCSTAELDRYPRGSEHHVYVADNSRPLKTLGQLEADAAALAATRCARDGEQVVPVRTLTPAVNNVILVFRCE